MYKAGVIGCGRIGCSFLDDPLRGPASTHAGAYVECPYTELVAVCDIDESKAHSTAEQLGVKGYQSWREMVDAEHPQIVSVCTPPETHATLVVQLALVDGLKVIFCEKPIAAHSNRAEAMVSICRAHDVQLVINHQRRFSGTHQWYASMIRQGDLGEVQQASCYYTAGIFNTGTHLIDLVRMYLGDICRVRGYLSAKVTGNPLDPNIDGWARLSEGGLVTFQTCNVDAYAIFEMSILATEGRLTVKDFGYELQIEQVGKSPRYSGYRVLHPATIVRSTRHEEWILNGVEQIVDFLEGGPSPPSTGEDGLATLRVIEAFCRSATLNQEMKL